MAGGHDHLHHHRPAPGERPLASARTQRLLSAVVAVVAVAVLIGLVVLRPGGNLPRIGAEFGFGNDLYNATVVATDVGPCLNTVADAEILCERKDVEITSGSVKGKRASFELSVDDVGAPALDVGDKIVVTYNPAAPEGVQVGFQDFQRRTPMLVLLMLFVVAVVVLGRVQGLRALLALAVTLALVVGFLLPALLDGKSPLPVALVTAGAVALVALYLTHGINERTTVALLGTFGALALTGVLGAVFVELTHLSGRSEESINLAAFGSSIDVHGLLLAGIVIGSLGVLDDVTVTQVSAVWELHNANTSLTFIDLYRAALRIGRDHIASTVNTLVLAYAAAALPLLLLYTQAGRALSGVATGDVVATEIVRTLVGSIGLVASVPITTALAALVVAHPRDAADRDRGGAGRDEPPDDPDVLGAPEAMGSASWDDFAPDDAPG
jgi:uncharacterized membrane protein